MEDKEAKKTKNKLSERVTAWRADDVRRWLDEQGKEAA